MTDTPLYLNTVTSLNQAWSDLQYYFGRGDYRAGYLSDFNHILSMAIPDEMIWQTEEYRNLQKLQPLPPERRTKVTRATFENYLVVYQIIMRRIGLVDKDPEEHVDDVMLFDLAGVEK